MKTKFKTPELFIDDHHGVYMGQIAWSQLANQYKLQAKKVLSEATIKDLENVESEFHCDACDQLTNVKFKTPTGQQWSLQYAEGGMWAIPQCFYRTKEANNFFGC